jgi:hypothetical protein
VARAKRTDRAEARRRSRAALAATLDQPDLDVTDDADGDGDAAAVTASPRRAANTAVARTRPGAPASSNAIPPRPGVASAFRGSFTPLDWRTDLRVLPRLLLTKAFLAPTVASGLAFVLVIVAPSQYTVAFYQFFSYQLPVAAVFVAGFFAPRASYLLGGLVAVASVLFQVPLFAGYGVEFILGAMVSGAIYGGLFAAAAAWYRRFLSRANPNRARPQATTSRRPDGKIPKKPQQRPMLARKR